MTVARRRGFFARTELVQSNPRAPEIPLCGACGLYKTCGSPKMAVAGGGRKKILVVGEAPGRDEDLRGEPFVGFTGRKLEADADECGVDLRRDCWLTNSLICFTGDSRVQSPSGVKRVYRRSYSGVLVVVKTLEGRVLTGTPNHPILTPSGWVPLGLLNEGDDLVCCSLGQGVAGDRANVDDPPPRFDEVFRSFSKLGHLERVDGRSVDFHGDGENGDVDVVCPDSLLGDGVESSVDQHGGELSFVSANELQRLLLGFGRGHSSFSDVAGWPFSSAYDVVSGLSQRSSTVGASPTQTNFHGVTPPPSLNSYTVEYVSELVEGDTKGVGERLKALPGTVTLDRILKIERKSCQELFGGDNATNGPTHVYNLETGHGYYMVDGIVVSNCRPPGNKIASDKWVGHCRANLLNTIKELQPEVIVLLGAAPTESLVGWLWRERVGGIVRWAGWRMPVIKVNAWVCPTFHPAWVYRNEGRRQEPDPVRARLFRRHLRAALALRGRPHPGGPPDYRGRVKVVFDDERAAVEVATIHNCGRPTAVDYETTTLKPDGPDARVVCCALSNGPLTAAFPWGPKVRREVGRLLADPEVPKRAHNMKFEDRWSRAEFGAAPRGWQFDDMIGTHVADCRRGICGLKFQALARLGQEDYDGAVRPFLKARGGTGNAANRIKEVGMEALLNYCGMDAVLEWELAERRVKELLWS